MALITSQKEPQKPSQQQQAKKKRIIKHPQEKQQKQKLPSSWDQIKNLLSCKQIEVGSNVHDPSSNKSSNNYSSKLGSSCSSICSFKDVVHGNTRVVHHSPEGSALGLETRLLTRKAGPGSSSARSASGGGSGGMYNYYSSRGMQFSKLSGCYECRMIVDPTRYPLGRNTICSCNQCGEAFPKIESLELHQKVRHAVSELGPEDSGRNIVEIIFKSSWLKKDNPIFKIERILKVHNTQRTIQRFEDCRDAVKARALYSHKKNPRCAADGNELLRFHCTTLTCSLGSRGLTGLCGSIPSCGVCTTIRHGFQYSKDSSQGVRTTASSGRAHDLATECNDGHGRAMLVCRVIAGRVKHASDNQQVELESAGAGGSYDSVAGQAGIYSTLEELFVFNTNAILPCFVVIYTTLGS